MESAEREMGRAMTIVDRLDDGIADKMRFIVCMYRYVWVMTIAIG